MAVQKYQLAKLKPAREPVWPAGVRGHIVLSLAGLDRQAKIGAVEDSGWARQGWVVQDQNEDVYRSLNVPWASMKVARMTFSRDTAGQLSRLSPRP